MTTFDYCIRINYIVTVLFLFAEKNSNFWKFPLKDFQFYFRCGKFFKREKIILRQSPTVTVETRNELTSFLSSFSLSFSLPSFSIFSLVFVLRLLFPLSQTQREPFPCQVFPTYTNRAPLGTRSETEDVDLKCASTCMIGETASSVWADREVVVHNFIICASTQYVDRSKS